MRLHDSRHHLAVLAVRELKILYIGPNHSSRILVRHIYQLVLVVIVEGILVVTRLLLALAHDYGLGTRHRRLARNRIGMDRDEEVSARLVGYVGTRRQILVQRLAQRRIGLARIYHLYLRQLLLDQRPQLERHGQIYILLLHAAVCGAREGFASVAGVDDNNPHAHFVIIGKATSAADDDGCRKEQTTNQTFHTKTDVRSGTSAKKRYICRLKPPCEETRKVPSYRFCRLVGKGTKLY